MRIEKIHKQLAEYFDQSQRKKKIHCERIDDLLDKLKKKEHKIEKALEKETNSNKRKHLKIELKTVHAQRKKGDKRRKELEAKCK